MPDWSGYKGFGGEEWEKKRIEISVSFTGTFDRSLVSVVTSFLILISKLMGNLFFY